ncbi:MAG TPA: hypothetical protein VGQ55_07925 [Pyrinomonadaceae bacterium]|jgi:hypothetical protein|nr:hypothetical protein [Pyrinomonadaceae bacterium]
MKKPVLAFVFCIVAVAICAAQCDNEPVLDRSKIIATEMTSFSAPVEASLSIKAAAPKTSWRIKGAEAGVITIFLDGKYNQDLILFADGTGPKFGIGDEGRYSVFLGRVNKGPHRIDIVQNEKYSAPNAGPVLIEDEIGLSVGASDLAFYVPRRDNAPANSRDNPSFAEFRKVILGYANAPLIYARPNTIGKFSDVPLLTYFETFDEPNGVVRIRYTTIFSNEDGGTQSKALMARWGRMVDTEWIYEMRIDKDGKIFDETYQASNHVTKKFEGKRLFGSHPVLYVVTDNNNFSDAGCSPLRFAPDAVGADLSHGSRETVLEIYPWIYRVMADEAWREDRVVPGDKGANTIGDPRNYLYAEVYNESKNSAITVEAEMKGGETVSSDLGVPQMRVDRSGYSRIAIELPTKKKFDDIESFSIWCHAKTTGVYSECKDLQLIKVITLDENYLPIQHSINMDPQTLTNGESAYHSMKKAGPAERKKKIVVYKPV